jgi:hypothetical protein
MRNLKRFGISVALLCVLAMTAFAGETNSPPCTPGETNSPPCSVAQTAPDDSTAPPVTTSPSVVIDEYSIGELVIELAQHLLTIY